MSVNRRLRLLVATAILMLLLTLMSVFGASSVYKHATDTKDAIITRHEGNSYVN